MTADASPVRAAVVDPSAFTPAYDHALCTALAHAGASVQLVTSRFAYGDVPTPDGYVVRELFYRRARGAPGSRARRLSKLVSHAGDTRALRQLVAGTADVVHFQWLAMPWLDAGLLPDGPLVLTAHDLLPREPRLGQARAQLRLLQRMNAVIVHSQYGRGQLVSGLNLPADKVHVIHHGAFEHVAAAAPSSLPAPLDQVEQPVVLFFGLVRPYKGVDTLLDAWRGVTGAELWVVGRPMIEMGPLRAAATGSVRFVDRYVPEHEVHAYFRRADVIVLPYERTERFDQSGVLATALAFGKPIVLTDIGGFPEVAATGAGRLVAAGDTDALRDSLQWLIDDPSARARLGQAALAAARGPYSWESAARKTLELYRSLLQPEVPRSSLAS
jgi:glycosyltransferase involved in cell wall biosynthesis